MHQLAELKEITSQWRQLEQRVEELIELSRLATEESGLMPGEDIHTEIEQVASQVEKSEFQLLLSGEYDKRNALLAIHSGAGGTESQDWAEMLLRMYMRWAEQHSYQVKVLDLSPGEEAGIKSAFLEIIGEYAYGYLKSERGVHRLVRLSPFDADHARHTSFALIEALPEVEQDVEVRIDPGDLRIETFRSSGPGGQHMQKTSTAVRITHLPTGLTASCQSQRSQHQNKELALHILQARLLELELKKKMEEKIKLKGEYLPAAWGNHIRSYVLHPYKKVKDHRTDYETSDIAGVLDGKLDELMKAYLRSKVGEGR
jgi:peptide chain release factor 2